MAIDSAYASASTYRGLLGKTDTSSDAAILLDLTATSRYLDWKLGRKNGFSQDTSAVARTYYPRTSGAAYARELFVDDIASKTGLVLKVDEDNDGLFTDETAWTIETDFVLWPENADKGSTPQPWSAIYVPGWSTKSGFPLGRRVQLTYIGGWPTAVPTAIERATAQLTAILRIETPRATGRVPEGIDQAIEESPLGRQIVAELMAAYAHREVSGLAFS